MGYRRRSFLVAAGAAVVGLHARPVDVLAASISPDRFNAGEALAAINALRQNRKRSALQLDGTLNRIAAQQARRLAELRTMTHAPDGQQLQERVAAIGYRGDVAENLADGYETFEQAIDAWLLSGHHRTTMLHRRYLRFGAAVAVSPDAVPGDWGIYWVTEFGT